MSENGKPPLLPGGSGVKVLNAALLVFWGVIVTAIGIFVALVGWDVWQKIGWF